MNNFRNYIILLFSFTFCFYVGYLYRDYKLIKQVSDFGYYEFRGGKWQIKESDVKYIVKGNK